MVTRNYVLNLNVRRLPVVDEFELYCEACQTYASWEGDYYLLDYLQCHWTTGSRQDVIISNLSRVFNSEIT